MQDLADFDSGYEFMRPLVVGWLSKVESAFSSPCRKRWREVGEECTMFYNKSAAAMWDGEYSRKVWRGIKAPKFRITINKAFEFVAIYGPNLIWDTPHRTVTPKRSTELPQALFGLNPEIMQAMSQQMEQDTAKDNLVSKLTETWLNYTPREMPDGGLEAHNELAVLDAMLLGLGVLQPATFTYPGSDIVLTGCFRKDPRDVIIDPDFKTFGQAKWMALRHVDPHWVVEKRFGLPKNSLKGKATLESNWHRAELAGTEDRGAADRKSGKTNDCLIWYEIWSKMGIGARMTGMPEFLKMPLEETVGDYAYLCICPDCPYPLNCSSEKIRQGATPQQVREHFEWPVPLWTDGRWPFEFVKFYEDPDHPYGVPPLAPALGELKAINCIVSWLVNRTYHSSRQMWAVLGQYHDDMKKQLEDGSDLSVFAIPPGTVDDIKKVCQLIEMKEVNKDAWAVLELLSNAFDKRTGLTEFGAYGGNQDGTQNRTAEETQAKQRAFGVRPEYMQKKVIAWQSRAAGVEAMLAWMFVKSKDTEPLLGRAGAMLWRQFIENSTQEQVVRQMSFEVAASSIQRPNRDRNISNLQEMLGRFLPACQSYGELTQDFTPVNGAMKKWGELHDMDMTELMIPAKDPNAPEAQMAQAMQQAELQKTQAEAMKLQSEAQANPAELKMAELQMEQEAQQVELQLEIKKLEADLEAKKIELQLKIAEKQAEMQMDAQMHQQDMAFKQQEGQVDLQVKQATGAQQIMQGHQQLQMQKQQMAMQKEKGATDLALTRASGKTKLDQAKAQSDAKVSAIKAQAKVKPPQKK